MQLLSSRGPQWLKRRFALLAIALFTFGCVALFFEGSLLHSPFTNILPLLILIALWYFFYRKMAMGLLVDEVVDCGTYLKVRRGGIEETVQLSDISKVDVPTSGLDRIAVHLVRATRFGLQIDFMPDSVSRSKSWQAKLAEVNRVATELRARIDLARGVKLV